jgi:hypothetical protein
MSAIEPNADSGSTAEAGSAGAHSVALLHETKLSPRSKKMTEGNLSSEAGYRSFAEFYPFYLSQHANVVCRRLHFTGTLLVLVLLAFSLLTGNFIWLLALPVVGYGFAWLGHFAFEKNRPATFNYPIYSLRGDWVMFFQMLSGRIKF